VYKVFKPIYEHGNNACCCSEIRIFMRNLGWYEASYDRAVVIWVKKAALVVRSEKKTTKDGLAVQMTGTTDSETSNTLAFWLERPVW